LALGFVWFYYAALSYRFKAEWYG